MFAGPPNFAVSELVLYFRFTPFFDEMTRFSSWLSFKFPNVTRIVVCNASYDHPSWNFRFNGFSSNLTDVQIFFSLPPSPESFEMITNLKNFGFMIYPRPFFWFSERIKQIFIDHQNSIETLEIESRLRHDVKDEEVVAVIDLVIKSLKTLKHISSKKAKSNNHGTI